MTDQTPLPGIDPGLPRTTNPRPIWLATHDDIDAHLDESLGLVEALYEVLFHRREQSHAPNDFHGPITLVNLLEDRLRATQKMQARQFEAIKGSQKIGVDIEP